MQISHASLKPARRSKSGPIASTLLAALMLFIGDISHAQTASTASDGSEVTQANSDAGTSHRDLSSNECLQKLDGHDQVIASIAFKDGLDASAQLKELIKRKPWGTGTPDTSAEIQSALDTQSPFLIITLTKKQVLTLDKHRDIIRWVLVQSTTKTCE